MLYSRTGQYARAEKGPAKFAKIFPRNLAEFYPLHWTGQKEAAREYHAWLDGRPNLQLAVKVPGAILMGDLEKGLDYLEPAVNSGIEPWPIKVGSLRTLPPTLVKEVWAHPRHRVIVETYGVTDVWCEELLEQVNKLTPITGIVVRPDEF